MTARRPIWVFCLLLVSACGGKSAQLDCSGTGEVSGSYSETNSGSLSFLHGLAWREPHGDYIVLFTGDPTLAAAGRSSPNPEYETGHAAQMLGELVVGFQFEPNGKFRERITLGTSTSRGSSGADRGRITLQADGCARGDVQLDYYGEGSFALPLIQPEQNGRHLTQALEIDSRPEAAITHLPLEHHEWPGDDDFLGQWSLVHAQLSSADPVEALGALNFSPAVAATLARDPRALRALQRVRSQCPNPLSAALDEYGEVSGASQAAPGIVLHGTALTSLSDNGAILRLCYVMQRNAEFIEQCFPFTQDCSQPAETQLER